MKVLDFNFSTVRSQVQAVAKQLPQAEKPRVVFGPDFLSGTSGFEVTIKEPLVSPPDAPVYFFTNPYPLVHDAAK